MLRGGLQARLSGTHITLTGANGLVLKLTFAGKSAAGTLTMMVTEKKTGKKYAARLAVTLTELSVPPGRPSATPDVLLA
jgi:hypothetical protein